MLLIVKVILSLLTSTGMGDAFSICDEIHDTSKLANTSTTEQVLHVSKVASIAMMPVSNDLASRCSPKDGGLTLSRSMCSGASITTVKITTRRYKRTVRRTAGCIPLGLHSTVIPITGVNSALS